MTFSLNWLWHLGIKCRFDNERFGYFWPPMLKENYRKSLTSSCWYDEAYKPVYSANGLPATTWLCFCYSVRWRWALHKVHGHFSKHWWKTFNLPAMSSGWCSCVRCEQTSFDSVLWGMLGQQPAFWASTETKESKSLIFCWNASITEEDHVVAVKQKATAHSQVGQKHNNEIKGIWEVVNT